MENNIIFFIVVLRVMVLFFVDGGFTIVVNTDIDIGVQILHAYKPLYIHVLTSTSTHIHAGMHE